MSKILVTGGAGFIGSHLVDRLIKANHTVWVFDDLSGGNTGNLNKKAHFIKGDCRNIRHIEKLFVQVHPDIVYHLASNAAENKAQFSPIDITSRNYDAFIKILTYSIKNKVKRFIFTSSIAVYGSIRTPFKESDIPEPEDLYGVTKLAAEKSLEILSKVHNFEYVIVRPHNVYGPRQNMRDPYRNVIMLWMNAILKKEPYFIYGDGQQRRCFSYIDEVVEAIYKCAVASVAGMTFNLGSDKDYSLNELSGLIQDITKSEVKPKYILKRPQEVDIAIADHTIAKKILGYKDSTALKSGLEKTWEYVKSVGPQKVELGEIELEKNANIPQNWVKKK